MSTHTGGSRTFVEHNKDLRAELGREPTLYELMQRTHTNKDGIIVDGKARSIDAVMRMRMAESSDTGSMGQSQDLSASEINQLYLDLSGGVSKGRVYEIGKRAGTIYPDALNTARRAGVAAKSTAALEDAQAARAAAKAATEMAAASQEEARSSRQECEELRATVRRMQEEVTYLMHLARTQHQPGPSRTRPPGPSWNFRQPPDDDEYDEDETELPDFTQRRF